MAFSPDGKRLAASSSGEVVKVWDVSRRKLELTYTEHARGVYCVAFSPDGELLASGDGEPEGKRGTVKIWNAHTGQTVFSYTVPQGEVMFTSVAFSPDGRRLVACSPDQSVKGWDLTTGKEVLWPRGQPGRLDMVVFSPDGKQLAGCLATNEGAGNRVRGDVKVWDAQTGGEILHIHAQPTEVHGLAYSPDGKLLAGACFDGTVKLWDARTGMELSTLAGHTARVSAVAFSPDGKRLASGGGDKTVRLWDVATRQEVLSLRVPAGDVRSISFSPDGQRLASGEKWEGASRWEGAVRVWEAVTGE